MANFDTNLYPNTTGLDLGSSGQQWDVFAQDVTVYRRLNAAIMGGIIVYNPSVYASLQAALTAAAGGQLYIPAGTYTLTSALTIPNNTRVCGAGKQITKLVTSGTTAFDVFSNLDQATGVNIAIEDLSIDASSFSSGSPTGVSVHFKNVTGLLIQNIEANNSYVHGIWLDDGCSQFRIVGNDIKTVRVGSCILVGNDPLNATVTDGQILDNYCTGSATANGIFVTGSKVNAATGTARIVVANNRCYHNGDTQIEIGNSSADITCLGNICTLNAAGETGILVRSCQGVSIVGNEVKADTTGAGQIGIYVWNNAGDNVPFADITVVGNTVKGLSGSASSGIAWSASVACDGLTIVGNTSIGNTTNFDPKTTNITNLKRGWNSDGINNSSESIVTTVTTAGALFNPMIVRNAGPGIILKDTSQAAATGELWRFTTSGGSFLFNMNTAVAGDFSTNFDAIAIDNTGQVSINQNNLLIGAGKLTATINGLVSKYNNISTAGNGLASILGSTSQKAETGADTNVLTFTPPAVAGTYRIGIALSLSAANTATLGWTATYKDSNGNAQTPTNLALFQSGAAAPALTFTTSTAGNYYASAIVDVDNSATAIVIKLTFSGTSFAGKLTAKVEAL